MKVLSEHIKPVSKEELIIDFGKLGLQEGSRVMVHSSLSKIGWVIGGPQTVVQALFDVIGDKGTMVMPAATPLCLHPSDWEDITIPEKWISKLEKYLPAFEKDITPTTMGIIPETFRNWPGTLRSNHPISSVSAYGELAGEVIHDHQLEISEGVKTPYEKIYNFNFQILLLGVGFNRCTMLHFAESRSVNRRLTKSKYQISTNRGNVWTEVTDMGNDNGTHFPKIGALYLQDHPAKTGQIGNADSILVSCKKVVDFGTSYFNNI